MTSLKEDIECLYEAILKKDETRAYISVININKQKDLNVQIDASSIFPLKPHVLDPDFIINPLWVLKPFLENPDDINWILLAENLKDILEKKRPNLVRHVSSERIEAILKGVNALIDRPYETTCFECGSLIKANEEKCNKCGWSWNK